MNGGTLSCMAWLTAGVTVAVAVGDSEPVADVVIVTLPEAEGEAVVEAEREAAPEALGEDVGKAVREPEAVADGEGVLAVQDAAPGAEFV